KQKSKTSFTGAFDFLVQKGLMGQPLFLCLKRQNKSKHKERWLGEVKTFESDETRKECNEFSRAK
ncbi:hypothetical protein P7524_11525, partial [Staphylococcus aureus]|nr:hypothetical protein [Staphylococcus aureus]